VVVITPRYAHGDHDARPRMQEAVARHDVAYSGVNVRFWLAGRHYDVGVHIGRIGRARVFLLDHHELFDGLYWGLTSEEKLRRRVGFARACAEVICTFGLQPVATFTNDAYAGLFNGIARHDGRYRDHESFRRNSFLHVIHNGGGQYADAFVRYEHDRDLFALFDLPAEVAGAFAAPSDESRLHCMAAGVRSADRVFTVSPSYAAQIASACDGLEPLLGNIVGISNGIGRDFRARIDQRFASNGFVNQEWPRLREQLAGSAALHAKIAARYPEIFDGPSAWSAVADERRRCIVARMARKLMLQNSRGLEVDPDKILLVMIHRITEQKGFQLLLEASRQLFCELGYQAVVGGAVAPGDVRGEELAHGLRLLCGHFPKDVSVRIGFEDVAAPFLAADVVAMPSQSEPGGLVQLEAFACGALVLARATGGLRDTVQPIRATAPGHVAGNGFLFEDYSSAAFAAAAAQAARFVRNATDRQLHEARRNAESSVFHWDRVAREYVRRVYADKELLRLPPTSEPDARSPHAALTTSVA
jgi:glycogen synthase